MTGLFVVSLGNAIAHKNGTKQIQFVISEQQQEQIPKHAHKLRRRKQNQDAYLKYI